MRAKLLLSFRLTDFVASSHVCCKYARVFLYILLLQALFGGGGSDVWDDDEWAVGIPKRVSRIFLSSKNEKPLNYSAID